MIYALKESSRNRRNPSRFEELDLPLFEIALVHVNADHAGIMCIECIAARVAGWSGWLDAWQLRNVMFVQGLIIIDFKAGGLELLKEK
jgi:hypothetical protein